MIDIKAIRDSFPQLRDDNNYYLDSSSTSLTPNSVIDGVDEYYRDYRASVHRGASVESLRATEEYEKTRTSVARFIGATNANEIIFTSGATEGSNMFVRMIEESGINFENKNIVTTDIEHHASYLPLLELCKRKKIEFRSIPLKELDLDYAKALQLIDKGTSIVAIALASNVTGVINAVRRIIDIAHKYDAIVLVDATAAVGHIPVDVNELDADALYFSGHKMFAPTGVGVLWARRELLEKFPPVVFGGHMIASLEGEASEWLPPPAKFEAGTKNIAGVIGLGKAIEYIKSIGIDAIHKQCVMLACYAIGKLEQTKGVKIFSSCDPEKNIGIVSFTVDWAHPHDIAEILARDNVSVRAGHHCAIPLHKALDVSATIRASFHVYNTKADVDALMLGMEKAKKIFST